MFTRLRSEADQRPISGTVKDISARAQAAAPQCCAVINLVPQPSQGCAGMSGDMKQAQDTQMKVTNAPSFEENVTTKLCALVNVAPPPPNEKTKQEGTGMGLDGAPGNNARDMQMTVTGTPSLVVVGDNECPISNPGGVVLIKACGGDGGCGGNGSKGRKGSTGRAGKQGEDGEKGGTGGKGGDGGMGGPGGSGGHLFFNVLLENLPLLMLLEIDASGGKGGRGGVGGEGGDGGEGGAGGPSYTSGSGEESVHHSAGQQGPTGSRGPHGKDGMNGADGPDGSTTFQVFDGDRMICKASDRFEAQLTAFSFTDENDDGIFEPSSAIVVKSASVRNVGLLPLPAAHIVFPSNAAVASYNPLALGDVPYLDVGALYTTQEGCQPLILNIPEVKPSIGKPYKEELSFGGHCTLLDRKFVHSELGQTITVQYPVQMDDELKFPTFLGPEESSAVSFFVNNISLATAGQAYGGVCQEEGQEVIGNRVTVMFESHHPYLQLLPAKEGESSPYKWASYNQGTFDLPLMTPQSACSVSFLIAIHPDATQVQFDELDFTVSLFLRGKCIEKRPHKVRVVPVFVPGGTCDLLIATNKEFKHAELNMWTLAARVCGLRKLKFWDIERYGNFFSRQDRNWIGTSALVVVCVAQEKPLLKQIHFFDVQQHMSAHDVGGRPPGLFVVGVNNVQLSKVMFNSLAQPVEQRSSNDPADPWQGKHCCSPSEDDVMAMADARRVVMDRSHPEVHHIVNLDIELKKVAGQTYSFGKYAVYRLGFSCSVNIMSAPRVVADSTQEAIPRLANIRDRADLPRAFVREDGFVAALCGIASLLPLREQLACLLSSPSSSAAPFDPFWLHFELPEQDGICAVSDVMSMCHADALLRSPLSAPIWQNPLWHTVLAEEHQQAKEETMASVIVSYASAAVSLSRKIFWKSFPCCCFGDSAEQRTLLSFDDEKKDGDIIKEKAKRLYKSKAYRLVDVTGVMAPFGLRPTLACRFQEPISALEFDEIRQLQQILQQSKAEQQLLQQQPQPQPWQQQQRPQQPLQGHIVFSNTLSNTS